MATTSLTTRAGSSGGVLWWVGVCCAAGVLGAVGLAVLAGAESTSAAGLAAIALAGNVVLLAATLQQRRTASGLRREASALRQDVAAAVAETAHLVERRLPAVARGDHRAPLPGLAHPTLAGTPWEGYHQAAVDLVREAVRGAHEQLSANQAAYLALAQDMQAMALDQQRGLDAMERSHDSPETLEGLMHADHAAAQLARKAQTLMILCGTWPQRRWTAPVPLLDVVRGAQSRIPDYQRVQVRGGFDHAVVPQAAEALVHAVAELLDNAARHSPETTSGVLVTIGSTRTGAVVEIDDAGPGMSPRDLKRARLRLDPQDSSALPGPVDSRPQLGLVTVGRICAHYGFSVILDGPSSFGGVRAVVHVPAALLAEGDPSTTGSYAFGVS
ncbi:hypothetical protein AQ490_26670 [Wenjunlia vitaminophila]|uniref:histidine kinase n=1 Tax=Wenjunlia vitaminophila TaxID=76728 RepID=A0A0T6LPS4_WENVI|nr:ATP-binding protein [Wenjunlia vitaminophila]KRV48123.1 hypothetical protein AQ490_26670 [Wenjunlia vitaminophila]